MIFATYFIPTKITILKAKTTKRIIVSRRLAFRSASSCSVSILGIEDNTGTPTNSASPLSVLKDLSIYSTPTTPPIPSINPIAIPKISIRFLLGFIGSKYYSGSVGIYLGFPPPESPTFTINIPTEFWYTLGGIAAFLVILMGFTLEPEFGWVIMSIFTGGLVMVTGYFLYEQLILGVLAIAEIPINIGQMLIGLIVSVPVYRAVKRYLKA